MVSRLGEDYHIARLAKRASCFISVYIYMIYIFSNWVIKPPSRTLMRKVFGGNDHQFDLTERSNGLVSHHKVGAPDRVLAPKKSRVKEPQ